MTLPAGRDADRLVGLSLTPIVDLRFRGEGRSSNPTDGDGGGIWDRLGSVTDGGGSMSDVRSDDKLQ